MEIKDIFTWTEAFTIFKMVLSAVHLHRWPCLSKYKLLIIQTACYFSGSAWLEYDLTFRKHAAAFGHSDWSGMNLDLYNFHLRSPALTSPPPRYLGRLLPWHQLHRLSLPVTPAWSLLFATHGTTGSAAGLLAGANIDTAAVTVKMITPRSPVHFPTLPAHDPGLRHSGGEGDGTEWALMPGEACVQRVNSLFASPGG